MSRRLDCSPAAGPVHSLLSVRDLHVHFPIRRGIFGRTTAYRRAVDGVSIEIAPGSTLGLVGESGCGKTTLGRAILRLLPATSGQVLFDGEDVFATSRGRMRDLRKHMQIVFQDPSGSLDPRMTAGDIIAEPLLIHQLGSGRRRLSAVSELMERVGLAPSHAGRYPHEFSGGERQRIGIARALSLRPRFIVWDEPVSALDVSIQSQILNLLRDLQHEFALTCLFIAHNLAVVRHVSDTVAVMYQGKIVETAGAAELYSRPTHPYTAALMSAVLEPEVNRQDERAAPSAAAPSPLPAPPRRPI